MKQYSHLIGGILLVSGTTIGAGMLALPVVTGMAGFLPTFALLIFYWIYMTFTAFLLLEVNLWMQPQTNLISMARHTLGRWGEIVSWAAYLFLLYSLTTAYIAGSGPIVRDIASATTGVLVPEWMGSIPLLLMFGFFVYKGTKSVDYVNRLLMAGLAVAYIVLLVLLIPYVKSSFLVHADWSYITTGISVIATSFGFHIIIPTLTVYFDRDVKKLKIAIWIGSLLPLAVYILWEMMTLGVLPLQGSHSIAEGYLKGSNGAHLLVGLLEESSVAILATGFSFFAIVTSFLGVSLSLNDFLADGLKIQKTRCGRVILYGLTFLPPVLFTLTNPRAFLVALEYAGAFGVTFLLGFLPALMVWRGRYHKEFKSKFMVKGGKCALLMAMIFSVLVIIIEIAEKF